MSKERRITAAELMKTLQADSHIQNREAEKDRARERRQLSYDESIRPYLTHLHSLGMPGNSLQEIINAHSPLPREAVDVLLAALQSLSEPRLVESVVRALAMAADPFDGRPLQRCFESTEDEALKWTIVNTIALAHPHSIEKWLSELHRSPHWGKTLQGLQG